MLQGMGHIITTHGEEKVGKSGIVIYCKSVEADTSIGAREGWEKEKFTGEIKNGEKI
jgi:hypothetical protein